MAKRKNDRVRRTMEALKARGIRAAKAEYYNHHARRNVDLFGIIDIVALTPRGIMGIQVCGTDFQEHMHKMTFSHQEETRDWLEAGGLLCIWSWRKLKLRRGSKATRWKPRIKELTLDDL